MNANRPHLFNDVLEDGLQRLEQHRLGHRLQQEILAACSDGEGKGSAYASRQRHGDQPRRMLRLAACAVASALITAQQTTHTHNVSERAQHRRQPSQYSQTTGICLVLSSAMTQSSTFCSSSVCIASSHSTKSMSSTRSWSSPACSGQARGQRASQTRHACALPRTHRRSTRHQPLPDRCCTQ